MHIPDRYRRNRGAMTTCFHPQGIGMIGCFCDADPREGHRNPHRHEFTQTHYGLNYVISGSGTFVDERNQHHALAPGSCFQRLPGVRHSSYVNRQYGEVSIALDPTIARHAVGMGLIRHDPVVWKRGLHLGIVQRWHQVIDHMRAHTHVSGTQLLVGLLELISLCNDSDDEPDALVTAARFMDAHPRATLEEAAAQAGVSYHCFRRQFPKRFGMPPGQYLLRARMNLACHMLTTQSVKEVAAALGYGEASVFSRQFKRSTGLWPSEHKAAVTSS